MNEPQEEDKAEGVHDASRACKLHGCQARKVGTKPTFTCLSRGCLFADYVPEPPRDAKSGYPPELRAEYDRLIEQKFARTLSADGAKRLQEIRNEINAIDNKRAAADELRGFKGHMTGDLSNKTPTTTDWDAWDKQIVADIERLGEEEFMRRLTGEAPTPELRHGEMIAEQIDDAEEPFR